jgi:molybdopterin synthase sulfur carrier subunit
MQVKLYGLLRQAAGIKMMDLEFHPGITIMDILDEITHHYPILEKYIWNGPGELSKLAHVFVNGQNILHQSGLNTTLMSEDHVDIFPPVVGG